MLFYINQQTWNKELFYITQHIFTPQLFVIIAFNKYG